MSRAWTPYPVAQPAKPAPFVLCPVCPEAIGNNMYSLLLTAGGNAATWPIANTGIGYPFVLPEARTALSMFTLQGGVSSGNMDIGIYDAGGNKIVTMGASVPDGSFDIQVFNITDTLLAPYTQYYAWMSVSNTTATVTRWTHATLGEMGATGLVQSASVYPLPATITAAALTSNYLPCFGINFAATF